MLARAEALSEAHRYAEAVDEFEHVPQRGRARPARPSSRFARSRGEALGAQQQRRRPRGARAALARLAARRGAEFSDVDRADVLFRLGVCRYKLSSISTAVALFGEALSLAERSGLPCDLLRSEILDWRSRCYRRQRDCEAAREDVERALELAEGLDDRRALGHVYFQASLIAERNGHWVLARTYAERAKALLRGARPTAPTSAGCSTTSAVSTSCSASPSEADRYLKDAFGVALEVGHDDDAAQAVSSLAQVHLAHR